MSRTATANAVEVPELREEVPEEESAQQEQEQRKVLEELQLEAWKR